MNYFLTYTGYVLVLSLLMGLSTWKLFKKLGLNPLYAFVPFYNYYLVLKETKHPTWWAALAYVPVVGTIMMTVFHVFLMKKFGKDSTLQVILTVLLSFFYMGYVSYVEDPEIAQPEYLLPGEEEKEEKKETFIGSVTFAVVFATIIHTFITQPFGIPTGSMERTLLVGDFLFVNKLNYGYRMPMRPLALPFLQGTIFDKGKDGNPKNDAKSYVEAVKLPYLRLPGWEKPEKNDIVVFNYPDDSVHVAIDRKDPYVKRCVAVAGDVLEFKNGDLFINGKPEVQMPDADVQHSYEAEAGTQLDIPGLYDVYGFFSVTEGRMTNGNFKYIFQGLTDQMAKDFEALPEIIEMSERIEEQGKEEVSYFPRMNPNGQVERDEFGNALFSKKINMPFSIFPINKPWNQDWYGPLKVPKKGDVITLSEDNLPLYKRLITIYENNDLKVKDGKYFINDEPTNQYQVKYDYYMMIGDNRDASLDSRFFGFVPETNIIGKPMFTWLSVEGLFPDSSSSYQANGKKIRFDRMFKVPNNGERDKTSYWWLALLLIVLYFGWEYFEKLFKKNKQD